MAQTQERRMFTKYCTVLNTLRPRQNGRYFEDDTFMRIFLKENVRISIKVSLQFDPKVPMNNIPALVQIMAWCHPGNKPLSEAMMVNLPTHICVSRTQWFNSLYEEPMLLTLNNKLIRNIAIINVFIPRQYSICIWNAPENKPGKL